MAARGESGAIFSSSFACSLFCDGALSAEVSAGTSLLGVGGGGVGSAVAVTLHSVNATAASTVRRTRGKATLVQGSAIVSGRVCRPCATGKLLAKSRHGPPQLRRTRHAELFRHAALMRS